jgi:hypothetical protein
MTQLSRLQQGAVRRALDLAIAKLALPGCPAVYADFELPGGGTPKDRLDRLGIPAEEFLETLAFTDGTREPVCRRGRAALTTKPGTGVIFVCPGFARLITNPEISATLIIHESLHALGLSEDPPTSGEITRRVERRCWKLAKRTRGPRSDRPETAGVDSNP